MKNSKNPDCSAHNSHHRSLLLSDDVTKRIAWRKEFDSAISNSKMAVNISGLRRNIKNVAHNYTDAQVIDTTLQHLLSEYHIVKASMTLRCAEPILVPGKGARGYVQRPMGPFVHNDVGDR